MLVHSRDYSLSYQDAVGTTIGNALRPSLDDPRFESLLLRLDTTIDAEGLWSAIQFVLEQVALHDACALYRRSQTRRAPKIVVTPEAQNLRRWMEHRHEGDTMQAFSPTHPQPKVCRLSDVVFDPRQLCHAEFFRRHMVPNGWHHLARLFFWHKTTLSSEIAITRTAKQGTFTDHEMALLERLHPHIEATLRRLTALERRGECPADTDTPQLDCLTPAERVIVRLVRTGFSNKEIAAQLQKSVRTVKTQLTCIYRKYGVRSRTRLLALLTYPALAGVRFPVAG